VSREVVATCLWPISDELVLALDERFGEPVDAYVNGAQVWLRDDGPGGTVLEWRLHPVAGYRRPHDLTHHDVLAAEVFALRAGEEPPAAVAALWDGLEAFPAYRDEVEPAVLARHCTDALGLAPERFGVVDHGPVADAWEHSNGNVSVIELLGQQLTG
jgi:hypothetical protein